MADRQRSPDSGENAGTGGEPAEARYERVGTRAVEQDLSLNDKADGSADGTPEAGGREDRQQAGRRAARRAGSRDDASAAKARQPVGGEEGRRAVRRQAGPRDDDGPSGEGGREEGQPQQEEPDQEDGDDGRERQLAASSSRHLTASDVARSGMRELSELLGKQASHVTEVAPRHDGWLVSVEVVELERLPSSSDILALYEAELDMNGTLRSYRRTKRYIRGGGDGGG